MAKSFAVGGVHSETQKDGHPSAVVPMYVEEGENLECPSAYAAVVGTLTYIRDVLAIVK